MRFKSITILEYFSSRLAFFFIWEYSSLKIAALGILRIAEIYLGKFKNIEEYLGLNPKKKSLSEYYIQNEGFFIFVKNLRNLCSSKFESKKITSHMNE
jgi:hypothetical protein